MNNLAGFKLPSTNTPIKTALVSSKLNVNNSGTNLLFGNINSKIIDGVYRTAQKSVQVPNKSGKIKKLFNQISYTNMEKLQNKVNNAFRKIRSCAKQPFILSAMDFNTFKQRVSNLLNKIPAVRKNPAVFEQMMADGFLDSVHWARGAKNFKLAESLLDYATCIYEKLGILSEKISRINYERKLNNL